MEDLRLYMVYYLGASPCWNLRVASRRKKPHDAMEKSCRAEEVKIDGYKISIEKI